MIVIGTHLSRSGSRRVKLNTRFGSIEFKSNNMGLLFYENEKHSLHYGKKRFKIGKIWVSNEVFGNTFFTLLSNFGGVFYGKS